MCANAVAEEEKKVIAPLLGKLYVSPASSEEKIRDIYAEVSEAVDNQLLSDATGRNALYKIHVSLGKIVNSLDQQENGGRRTTSRSVSVDPEEKTIVQDRTVMLEADIKEEDEDEAGDVTAVPVKDDDDSLVEELLTDGEL